MKIITEEEFKEMTTFSKVSFYMYILSLRLNSLSLYPLDSKSDAFFKTFKSFEKNNKVNKSYLMKIMDDCLVFHSNDILELYDENKLHTDFPTTAFFNSYIYFFESLKYILPLTIEERAELINMIKNYLDNIFKSNKFCKIWSITEQIYNMFQNILYVYPLLNEIILPNDILTILTKTFTYKGVSFNVQLHVLANAEKLLLKNEIDKNKIDVINAVFHDLNQLKEYQIIKAESLFYKTGK